MKELGACQCGNIKYEITGENLGLAICYCTECQKLSTGIATYSMALKTESFKLLQGTMKQWERSSYNGNRNIANFCPECGNRIFHHDPGLPGIIRLKAGTLENVAALEPDVHVWLKSAPSWVRTPEGALTYDGQPSISELMKTIGERRASKVIK